MRTAQLRLDLRAALLIASLAALSAQAACSHALLADALSQKPLALEQIKPARVDSLASALTLDSSAGVTRSTEELRDELANALNAQLDESALGKSTQPARFRARIVSRESNNAWVVFEWIPPLLYPAFAPLYLESVDMKVTLDLGLQVGDGYWTAKGEAETSCPPVGPKKHCFQEALGWALNQALNSLQGPRRVVPVALGAR